jgi:putative ABC transport system permease protein
MAQAPVAMMMLAVRTGGSPDSLAAPVRAVIQALDPSQPVYHVKRLDTLVGESMLPQRASADLMALFSGLALVLAVIGIYGVVAYGVSQQTREFGVRMALGATPRSLLRGVLRQAALMVGAGVALGIAGALAAARLLGSVLHGVSSTDPVTYAGAAVLLVGTGVAACLVPAWRASTTRPVAALRME